MDHKNLEKVFFLLLVLCGIYFFWIILFPYITVVILSLTLSLLFQPLYKYYLRNFRNEIIASLAIILSVVVIVFLPLAFFAVKIFNEANALSIALSSNGGYDLGGVISNFLHNYLGGLNLPDIKLNYNESLQRGLFWITSNLGSLTSSFGRALFTGFLSLLGLYYFLKDGRDLKEMIIKVTPLNRKYVEEILAEVKLVMNSVVRGTILVAIIQGIAAGISFFIFGIPNPLFWSFVVIIFSPIPLIGTWLILIPAVLFLFFAGQTALSIGLLIWTLVVVNVIYNFIAPQLMHRGNNIHPFIILLSILGGISVFGPIGFLMGPLIAAFLLGLIHVFPKLMGNSD